MCPWRSRGTSTASGPEDEAFLFALYAATRADEMAAWGLDEATLQPLLTMQFTAQRGQYAAQYPDADHDIVLLGERAVGRLYVDRTAEGLLLIDVSLLPEVRGRGLGTALLRALQQEAAEHGRPLRLSVRLDNPARRLYRRLGFAPVGDDGVYEQMHWHAVPAGD